MTDLARHRIRSRIEAFLLDVGDRGLDTEIARRKAAAIGEMSGTVVEIGPGTGVNLRFYAPGTRVVAIEPNPVMRDHLDQTVRALPDDHALEVEIRSSYGESLDVESGSADGVVGTLLLCGVDDPARVIAEAHRVLRPGGTFFFVEHVRAPAGSRTARAQRVVRRPHHWMFNGCRVDQDTGALLRRSDFVDVDVVDVDLGRSAAYVRHHIVGTARRG